MLGEFSDREIEHEFQAAHWDENRKKMRYVCILSAAVYLGATAIDYAVLGAGPRLGVMAGSRFVVCLLGMVAVLFTRSCACNARGLGWALGVYMLSILLCETLELVVKRETLDISGVPASVVILLTFYFVLPPKSLPTLIACGLGSICFVLATAMLPAVTIDQAWNVGLFFCLANGFGYVSLTRYGRSQRREFQAITRLKMLAEIDALTQVYNRRKALQFGAYMFKEAERFKTPFSVLALDVDHFKAINDQYGHGGGDIALREIARRCLRQLRDVDAFGRIGGEEFIAFLPHTDLQQAVDIAERLRESIGAVPVQIDQASVTVRISVGVAAFSPGTPSLEMLVRRADEALYEAKSSGRNRVCVS